MKRPKRSRRSARRSITSSSIRVNEKLLVVSCQLLVNSGCSPSVLTTKNQQLTTIRHHEQTPYCRNWSGGHHVARGVRGRDVGSPLRRRKRHPNDHPLGHQQL